MAKELEGRQVVVTGGTGGLGPAVVEALVGAGATCHLPVRETGTVPPAEVQVTGGVDLTNEGAVASFYAALPSLWASIHLAGGFRAAPITESSRADLDYLIQLNLITTFLCCREAVKAFRRSKGGGRIVNVGARVSEVPAGGMVPYTASKGAVAALTRSLAAEIRREGILVNAILPSIIDTPANRAAMPDADTDKWPKPEQIARTILWLASPANELTTGALVPVYGNA